jgi:ABC-2 type transport system permease protein
MSIILLVAIREFKQMTKTRGFLITLIGLPLVIAILLGAARYLARPNSTAFMVYDAGNGSVATAIDRRIDQDTHRPGEAPQFLRAATPTGKVTVKSAEAFGASVAPLLKGYVQTKLGPRRLVAAIYIPSNFGDAKVAARIWTSGVPDTQLMAAVSSSLTQIVQLRALIEGGIHLQSALRVQMLQAPIIVTQPSAGSGPPHDIIRSAAPIAALNLLLLASIMSGSMMLQSVLEERSSKLLESILACIRPDQLLNGKLLGLAAIGLLVLSVWIGAALLAAFVYLMQGPVGGFSGSADMALPHWMIVVFIFYFFTGYLMVSMIFVSIGSVSNSPQDAQAFMLPFIWVLIVPVVLMMTAEIRDPGGLVPRVLSWVPIYTPFAMLVRLRNGVPLWEIIGSGMLLVAFLTLELILIGRIFERNVLSAGQPLKWSALTKMILKKNR